MWEFKFSKLLLLANVAGLATSGDPHGHRVPRGPHLLRKRDTTYTTSLRDPVADHSFGASGQVTTVNAGVTRWLSGRGTHNFYGNVNNYGQIIISQTDYLKTASAGGQTADYVGHDANNGNLYTGPGSIISLNDYGSASAPTYDWYLRTMNNYGALQMCGRGDTGGSTYQLYCDVDCYNYGLIDMGQYLGRLGASFVWRNANLYPPGATTVYNTYNYGAFRISNVTYHNVQNVLGTGCYIIANGGTLYLEDGSGYYQNTAFGPTFPQQSIYFTDGSGNLHMDTQVYSHNSNFGPQVYGYSAGHAIEFYEVFPTTNIFTYDGTAGTLTVRFNSGNSVIIKIGTGYDATLFYTAKNPQYYNTAGYNAVYYRGTAPAQSVPRTCSSSVGTCGDPEATAGLDPGAVTTTVSYSGTGTFFGPTTTTTIPASGTNQATVQIITGAPYATATSYSNGLAATTTTTIPQIGTAPGTIVVIRPASYATTTSYSNGLAAAVTSTITQTGTAPGTIIVISPASYASSTSYSNGLAAAVTTTIPQTGTAPGTIIVVSPASYATTTSYSNGLAAAVTTTIPQTGTAPGTIVVIRPASYAGSTSYSNGLAAAVTTTIPQTGTAPGTIVVISPASYATSTSYSNGLAAALTTTVPQTGTAPGTVIIISPASYAGSTSYSNGLAAAVTTTIPQTGTAPGTIVIISPAVYATSTSYSNGLAAAVTTTIPQTGTAPGTVVVISPASYATTTSTSNGAIATTTSTVSASGTAPGTVIVIVPAGFTTVSTTSNVASAFTTTIPASGTAPGTVLVVNPAVTTGPTTTSSTATRPSVLTTRLGANQCVCRPRQC